MTPIAVVVMGVSGVGKSTVGSVLARRLGWTFLEADDDHSPESVAAMARGEPLDDAQRDVWIAAVRDRVARHLAAGENVVLACSALRHAHRNVVRRAGPRVEFVHLVAPRAVIERRLAERSGHFAGPGLLPSQLEDLEMPRAALEVDATRPVPVIVEHIIAALGLDAAR
ncbi:MAG TPA: gluconokinase, GntK/IdnK-type [Longimicrobiales bacterium]